MSNVTAPIIATPESIDRMVKVVRARNTSTRSAMKVARETMQSEELALGAAIALTNLLTEYEALSPDKRKESGLRIAIRAVYKDMSTAVSHERAILRKEINDEAKETEKLHATFPWRLKAVKGCFVVLSAAEFDAETANRRNTTTPDVNANTNDGEGDGADSAAPSKNADKAAQAIAALELALREMTADRDAWKQRAVLAEQIIADTKKKPTVSRKPKTKAAKVAKAA